MPLGGITGEPEVVSMTTYKRNWNEVQTKWVRIPHRGTPVDDDNDDGGYDNALDADNRALRVYHGTRWTFVNGILNDGLIKGHRHAGNLEGVWVSEAFIDAEPYAWAEPCGTLAYAQVVLECAVLRFRTHNSRPNRRILCVHKPRKITVTALIVRFVDHDTERISDASYHPAYRGPTGTPAPFAPGHVPPRGVE